MMSRNLGSPTPLFKCQSGTKSLLAATFAVIALSTPQIHAAQAYEIHASDIRIERFTPDDYQALASTKMFPPPTAGMVQYILTMPPLTAEGKDGTREEQNLQLQVQIGQTQMVDCNKHGLTGELKEHTLSGWGYSYYKLDALGARISTQMACFDQAKQQAFVRIPGELRLGYDSRMPKVFYLPEGAELRFRLWQAESNFQYAKPHGDSH
ncbi:serine protease inhibitor ecotin [Shewanella sp. AS16]|uniref:serine protease inhibitor ecotin n=1 Tax=Shewanella sp. AS16 TaxID=2907625 RepID=UPI003FA3714A